MYVGIGARLCRNVRDAYTGLFAGVLILMMSRQDFMKKHIIYVFTMDGEKVSFSNDNLVVRDSGGNVKLQTTCYRIFSLCIIGHITLTSGIIQRSHKFGFTIVLMTPSMRVIDVMGNQTEGNTLLRRLQYESRGTELGKHVIRNKILNQISVLDMQRTNDQELKHCKENLASLMSSLEEYDDVRSIMGVEGTAARMYFSCNFRSEDWNGRKPRIKTDFINSTLDIGYTILFNYVDSFLRLYGFDTYHGILHTEYYLRKSLVCDMVEPFRPLIDWQVRKSINLKQCRPEHFNVVDGRYLLSIEHNKDYVRFLSKPLIDNREEMFLYFQSFYRSFIRSKDVCDYPVFHIGGVR